MEKCGGYAGKLGIRFDDTYPPRRSGEAAGEKGRLLAAAIERTRRIALAVEAGSGVRPARAFDLAVRISFSPEYVPELRPPQRQSALDELAAVALQLGIPRSSLAKLEAALRNSREAALDAADDFEDAFLITLDRTVLADPGMARRRLNAWKLGSALTGAALVRAQGGHEELAGKEFERARILGDALNIAIPEMHEPTVDNIGDAATAYHYVMVEVGGEVGEQLADSYGVSLSRLFELAMKSMMAIQLYATDDPDDNMVKTLIGVIERTGKESYLPEALWRPLATALRMRKPHPQIRQAVSRFHSKTEAHLAAAVRE
jgi:hypothetical protein